MDTLGNGTSGIDSDSKVPPRPDTTGCETDETEGDTGDADMDGDAEDGGSTGNPVIEIEGKDTEGSVTSGAGSETGGVETPGSEAPGGETDGSEPEGKVTDGKETAGPETDERETGGTEPPGRVLSGLKAGGSETESAGSEAEGAGSDERAPEDSGTVTPGPDTAGRLLGGTRGTETTVPKGS
jgi:hypothetical protein